MAADEWIYGLHAVEALLRRDPGRIRRLRLQQGREDARLRALQERAGAAGVPLERVERRLLDESLGGARHQGVAAEVRPQPLRGERELPAFLAGLEAPLFLLVLDGVTDPHNLGACLRSADAAGVQAVILPRDKAVGLTPVVRKVACGAAETLPVFQVTNLARALRVLRDAGLWIYGAAGEAEQSLYQTDLRGPLALVLGSEGRGLRRLTREHCDALLRIPMHGSVASLNVSVAAGVMLFEACRQRES
ncbi:23S rRNA (guanosine(2251)-2'-O)-methyltransferase RlmB [Thiohalobacter sp. IOR34]|uniref:23S rRNA (guanosine(2251)-2'-O)-methyltransferase RlmB n=1 Tax=Thiohalobacter sp. IOR34 TaxID=3057176 RepID=UPI0025AFD54E|nr:23S rRNA (guanosine(2251)-2'-O)-methyltransferase RlmB [Thiohalobacter sp. IOR34]WJW74793.1 23S rRNA (guanosine(2251)-2'-O)-methyltransferase RlmB [Thiohalobacter sp. IOR34]